MKKIFLFLGLLVLISLGYIYYKFYKTDVIKIKEPVKINTEMENAIINDIYVYGQTLNFNGNLNVTSVNNISLLIVDEKETEKEIKYQQNETNIEFYIDNKINNGMYLDEFTKYSIYRFYLKVIDSDNQTKYYKITIPNEFKDIEYYTITNNEKNYKLLITDNNSIDETLSFQVDDKIKKDIYDVILDPGHGGNDPGACNYNNICEIDYTTVIVKNIKDELEKQGLKVGYTWNIDKITKEDRIENYGEGSRTGIVYEKEAKYLISIHLNSGPNNKGTGFEIYTSYNIDYTLAKNIANNLEVIAKASYSNSNFNKLYNGIYTRTFSSYDLKEIQNERSQKNLEPLNVSTQTNYYYMIRETGGKMTGAFVDGTTNDNNAVNPYRFSNKGTEAYLIECGYINNETNLEYIKNNHPLYSKAIANSIIEQINHFKQ